MTQPDGTATAQVRLDQWSNGGWAVEVITECKPGATIEAKSYLGASEPHVVTTYHCGVQPTVFQGRVWKVPPGFNDERQAGYPSSFTGTGTMTRLDSDTAEYVDQDGTVVPFVPVEQGQMEACR